MSGSDAAAVCAELRAAVDDVGFEVGFGFNSLATRDAAGARIVEPAERLPCTARRQGLDLAALPTPGERDRASAAHALWCLARDVELSRRPLGR